MARIIFLFLIRGGGSDLLDIQLQNPPPPIRFKRLFSTFQTITRDLVRTLLQDDDRVLFKSPLSSTRRLESLGFNQSTPKLKFLFECSPSERKSLGVHLLQLRLVFNRNMQILFLTGELKVLPSPFNFKRALASTTPFSSLPPSS